MSSAEVPVIPVIPVITSGAGWQSRRVQTKSGFSSYEVFTDPQGLEWIRAGSEETTELIYRSARSGLALRLKPRSRPFGGKTPTLPTLTQESVHATAPAEPA